MCLAVPAKIHEIDGQDAKVDFAGLRSVVSLALLPDARIGDFILVHAGFAIQKVDPEEAAEIIELFRQVEAMKEGGIESPHD